MLRYHFEVVEDAHLMNGERKWCSAITSAIEDAHLVA